MEQIPLYKPEAGKEELEEILKVFRTHWYTLGPKTKEFEENFAKYDGTKYATALSSCGAALYIALKAAGIKRGDHVIVPTYTFTATADAPIFCEATPVFCDAKHDTFNIDPVKAEEILKKDKKIKAIMPVHLFGLCCDMEKIMKLAKKYKIKVIEDCAHAVGSEFKGKKAGSFGSGCFSFYATKNMTTGEGGMLTTNEADIEKKSKLLRDYYMDTSPSEKNKAELKGGYHQYNVKEPALNFCMSEINAAMGVVQLRKLDKNNEKRRNAAALYNKLLKGIPGIITPHEPKAKKHVYHLYVIKVTKDYKITRDQLVQELIKNKITVGLHYPPLHTLTYYKKRCHYHIKDFPVAETLYEQAISLPMFPSISESQIKRVCEVIKK